LGGPRFKEIVDACDKTGSDDEIPDAGEGRRLDEGSSPTGSSSAFQEQGLEATHLRQQGTHGGRAFGFTAYETKSDDGGTRLTDATFDDGNQTLRRSIEEDEGIDMTENPTHTSANAFQPTWDFNLLTSQNMAQADGVPGSPLGSGAATDEAQHDSSGDEVSSRAGELDQDTDMDKVPGTSQIELLKAAEHDPPAYNEEPPPPDYRGEISRDDLSQFWSAKQSVHTVPDEDQKSEEAVEILLEDEDEKDKLV
jgi:ubiquitin carboxyl-terminal hydrolase 4/11/15